MEGEQFSLCWNNFHSNLSSGFHALYKEEDLVDVTLAAEGKYIKAHKTVLSVCSPYFKELFRSNPCKHPIVILQNVNYTALSSLLQFMYQGEVSVSQEEIPTFMKVAETLKIKGLTDNTSQTIDSNGLNDKAVKKQPPRPVSANKKVIRPPQPQPRSVASPIPAHVQSPQPVSSPASTGSGPPPAKKPAIEEKQPAAHSGPSKLPSEFIDMDEGLRRPKEEPMEPDEDTINSAEDFDMNQIFSNSMDAQNWNPEHMKPPDTSSPGTLQCIIGRRGNPRLIVDGHVFFKKSTYKGKAFWYCKNSRSPDKCPAVCWTMNGNIIKWPYMHTHSVIPDVFNPEEDTEVPIENLQEVLWQTSMT